jgi:hypothetical protein
MQKYLFSYHGGGMPDSEEEQAKHMAAWGEWMGAHAVAFSDMGAPCGAVMTVGADGDTEGGGPNPVSGYGIIQAVDMAAACNVARGCPIVTLSGGTVEVSETFEVDMG